MRATRPPPTRSIIFICISAAAAVLITRVAIFSPSFSSELTSPATIDLAAEIEKLRQENNNLKEKYAKYTNGIEEETNVKELLEKLRQENNDLRGKYAKCINNNEEDGIVKELFDALSPEKLRQLSTKFKSTYASAQPFPHIAIDDIFPLSIIQKVIQEHPESSLKDGCIPGSMCFRAKTQSMKSGIDTDERMGTYTRLLFSFLKSSMFTKFLEDISGISNLLPDPHFRGSGLHFTATGGNLDIHADFNKYSGYNLDRRVNMFIYLNDDWPEEYGGHLELWSKDMKSCYQRIKPKLGRFVVFSSTDFSYHGHPEPIQAPDGRARRSLALYYYTNGRPVDECLNNDCSGAGHSTLFQKPVGCERCLDDICRRDDTIDSPVWMASRRRI
ncbi:hypothetical protein ACHAXN_013248 [Cyclotella atomus]